MKENSSSSTTPSWQDEHTGLPKYLSEPNLGSRGWIPPSQSLEPISKQNPSHYQMGSIQVWDFIIDQDLDFILGNVVKYVCRAGTKPGESRLDDLKKAQAYITKAIESTNDL